MLVIVLGAGSTNGLDEDPFGYLNAEQLVGHLDILQDTFIPYSVSYEQIMDFTRSSVLMASPGSGKTMGRFKPSFA